MTQLLQMLKEATIFMLGAQILLYLGPGKKYEKYGKMIVSLLVLAQLAEPILKFQPEGLRSFSTYLKQYEQQNEVFTDRLEFLEQDSQSVLWEEMVQSVEQQLYSVAEKYDVRIERVWIQDGILTVELGRLTPDGGRQHIKREELQSAFSEKLGMAADSVEVVINEQD